MLFSYQERLAASVAWPRYAWSADHLCDCVGGKKQADHAFRSLQDPSIKGQQWQNQAKTQDVDKNKGENKQEAFLYG